MIIDKANSFVFLKPYKAASSSAELYLRQYVSPDSIVTGLDREATVFARERGIQEFDETRTELPIRAFSKSDYVERWQGGHPKFRDHHSAESIRRFLGRRNFRQFQKVSITRSPFERVVSWFFYDVKKWKYRKRGVWDFTDPREIFPDWLEYKVWEYAHVSKKTTWIGRKPVVDTWFDFHELGKQIEVFCASTFPDPAQVPVPNFSKIRMKSRDRPSGLGVPEMFDGEPQAVKLVLMSFGYDFDFFNYPTDPTSL